MSDGGLAVPRMPAFFDTHAHLDYPDFAADIGKVIERARAAGITKIISIGTDIESTRRAIKLAEEFPDVFAAAGWHPNEAVHAPDDIRPALHEFARHPKVVAIGETGMDYYRLPSREGERGANTDEVVKRRQAQLFQQHLEVAAATGLNVIVHQRGNCFHDTMTLFAPFADRVRAVFHCFAGTVEEMRRIVELGSLISFTGIVTFKNGQNVRDVVGATPMDKFMLETDCPFLAPVPYRGKRCEPVYVKEISETIAQVKGCTLDELSTATCATATNFFPKLKGV